MGYLNRWRHFPGWLFHHGVKSIPVANGSLGMGCMGCIGYPGHPVWEVTGACNLKCLALSLCRDQCGKYQEYKFSANICGVTRIPKFAAAGR